MQLMILGSFVLKLHVIEPIAKLLVMAPFPGIERNHVQEYLKGKKGKNSKSPQIMKITGIGKSSQEE